MGSDTSVDSNGARVAIAGNTLTAHALANVTTPAYFAEDLSFDFGWYEVAFKQLVIGDYVWIDANNDGEQVCRRRRRWVSVRSSFDDRPFQQSNAFERPLSGVTVQLRK